MKQKFTMSDLIQFIYRETSLAKTIAIAEALREDPVLYEQYQELLDGYLALPKARFSPKPETMQAILSYSERTAPHPTH